MSGSGTMGIPVSHKLILMGLSGSRLAVMKHVPRVSISTDDVWVLASEFERDQDEVFTASLRDFPSDHCAPGEDKLVNATTYGETTDE